MEIESMIEIESVMKERGDNGPLSSANRLHLRSVLGVVLMCLKIRAIYSSKSDGRRRPAAQGWR